MKLVRQWHDLLAALPAGWSDAQLRLRLDDPGEVDRAATLLGPLQPHRSTDGGLAFRVASDGGGPQPAMAVRLLELLDREKLTGRVSIESTTETADTAEQARSAEPSLPLSWDAALATLPADWSDLLGEIELGSSDYVERAALHLSPINPRRDGMRLALRFRSARKVGYGASPEMVRRCLERCEAESILGRAHVLRVLSDTHSTQTQGPVWQISGRTV